jgi:hypothetical protein
MRNPIIGKWEQPTGQPYPGLWFQFDDDGTFRAEFSEMGIVSSGTYTAAEGKIDMDQTQHTFGLLGQFTGIYQIDGDTLTMTLADPGGLRPTDLLDKNKRIYKRTA